MKSLSELRKRTKKGYRGFPMASVAFYGPDDQRASKAVLGIILEDGMDAALTKWFSEDRDLREDTKVIGEILEMIDEWGVRSVALHQKIFGCPHEEGVDYPDGEVCPQCPFWATRDRYDDLPERLGD